MLRVPLIQDSLYAFHYLWFFLATFENVIRVAMNAKQRKQICYWIDFLN